MRRLQNLCIIFALLLLRKQARSRRLATRRRRRSQLIERRRSPEPQQINSVNTSDLFGDENEFKATFRMSKDEFRFLLVRIQPRIQRNYTPIPAEDKLRATLYYLSSGCSFATLHHLFKLGTSTIGEFIPEVCGAIYVALKGYIEVPDKDWRTIALRYKEKHKFPNCCGAVGAKHVVIRAPHSSGNELANDQKKDGLIIITVVDDNSCFRYVNIIPKDLNLDGGFFRKTVLNTELEIGLLPAGHFLLSDAGLPMTNYLLKPFPETQLTIAQQTFNDRFARARQPVDDAFGMLADRFRIFEKAIGLAPDKTEIIVKACLAMHNWLRQRQTSPSADELLQENILYAGLQPIVVTNKGNNCTRATTQDIRNQLADWFLKDESPVEQPDGFEIMSLIKTEPELFPE